MANGKGLTKKVVKKGLFVDGTCTSCSSRRVVETVTCFFCDENYHAVNCESKSTESPFPSSYAGTWRPALILSDKWVTRMGRVLWSCDSCLTKRFEQREPTKSSELKADITLEAVSSTVAAALESFKTDMMNTIDAKLTAVIKPTPAATQVPLYSEKVAPGRKPQHSGTQQVMVISAASEDIAPTKSVTDVKRAVAKSLQHIPTNFVVANNDKGSVTVGFPGENSCEQGSMLLDNLQLSSSGFSTKKGKKMLPKLVVTGDFLDIFDDIDTSKPVQEQRQSVKDAIKQSIIHKNTSLKPLLDAHHTLDVVYVNKSEHSKSTVVLKVSPSVRLVIMERQQRAIYIGNMAYLAEDRHYIRQCYHCQQIGHVSADCPNKGNGPRCFYCMGCHMSKECSNKKDVEEHACAKCFSSTFSTDNNNFKGHTANSPSCPVTQREVQRIASHTEYHSKNVM